MPLADPVPDLVSLDLLRSVAELGSIRRAAQAHRISQPAASMRLRSLERTVGLDLLDRSGGRARLTQAGVAVVEWSGRMLDDMHDLMASTAALRNRGRTQLRMAASMTVAEYLVPIWLNRLRAGEPEVEVSLRMGNSEQVRALVAGGEADLGFVEDLAPLPELESRVVAVDELVLVVAPSHPWAALRRPLSASEVARTPLVVREAGSGTRQVLEAGLRRAGHSMRPLVELGSTTAIKAAVQSGTGPAVVSRLAAQGDVADGRLAIVAVEGLPLDRSIRAVWDGGRGLGAAGRHLLAQIGGPGRAWPDQA